MSVFQYVFTGKGPSRRPYNKAEIGRTADRTFEFIIKLTKKEQTQINSACETRANEIILNSEVDPNARVLTVLKDTCDRRTGSMHFVKRKAFAYNR